MEWMLSLHRGPSVFASLVVAAELAILGACSERVPVESGSGSASSGSSTSASDASTGRTADSHAVTDGSTSAAASSGGPDADTISASSSGEAGLECIPEDRSPCADQFATVSPPLTFRGNSAWPDSHTGVEAQCNVMDIETVDGCIFDLAASCERAAPEEDVPMSFQLTLGHLPAEVLAAQLAFLQSAPDLVFSFYQGAPMTAATPGTIRDGDGDLVALGLRAVGGEMDEGDTIAFSAPGWASTGDEWLHPFENIIATHVGCAAIEPLRTIDGYASAEIPIAFEFDGDSGPVRVFDRTVMREVVVDGSSYDVYVPFAFTRNGPGCATCGATEVGALVLRSDP